MPVRIGIFRDVVGAMHGFTGVAEVSMGFDLDAEQVAQFAAELESLRQEHRELDEKVGVLEAGGGALELQVQRLKKRKLALRDRIAFLEDRLTPDIIA